MPVLRFDRKTLPDIKSPVESYRGNSTFICPGAKNLPLNKFVPIGYSNTNGKYHILLLFCSLYSDKLTTGDRITKYSGYCSSFYLMNGDIVCGYLLSVDPNRVQLADSFVYVGHESAEEMKSYPVTDDGEGIHVYTSDREVLLISAEVNDPKFVVLDN